MHHRLWLFLKQRLFGLCMNILYLYNYANIIKKSKAKKANVFSVIKAEYIFGNGLIIINLTTMRKKKKEKKSRGKKHTESCGLYAKKFTKNPSIIKLLYNHLHNQ